MRSTPFLLAVLFATGVVHAQRAALFDELAPLYPDSDPATGSGHHVSDAPRGVPAGVHVLVGGLEPGAALQWRLTGPGPAAAEAVGYELLDVPVEQNTGLESRTEAWGERRTNPHVVRRAPFRVYEALRPIADRVSVAESGCAALRIEVPVAPRAEATTRSCELVLQSGDWRQTLRWDIVVHPVTVPPTGPQSRGYTNWFNPGLVAERHGLTLWSEPFWEMLGRYADCMARGRQNTFWIRWRDFTHDAADGGVTLDRARLERYVRLFLERGFTRVEGGQFAGRHGGDWNAARLDFTLTGSDVSSDEGRAELAAFLGEVAAALAALQLPPQVSYLQHLADEPTDTNAASYRALAEQVRAGLPGVRIFEATMSRALVGAVDVWCPQVQVYQRHRDFFRQRQAAGDGVWVYTCLVPGGPWLNRLLDQERLRPVYLGWALEKYELDGFLHWGLNHYRAGVDPFEQSVVPHGAGPPNFLPAGDSHVLYPGAEGPLSGQRFEAHRIGLEDAELLRMLKLRGATRAERIIARVLRAFDDYESDVAAYRAARRELLAALAAPLEAGPVVELFNGRDLDGWEVFPPPQGGAEETWRVRDGVLVCRGAPTGYIQTRAPYANYRLGLEWRWGAGAGDNANSGVLLRVIGGDRVWPRCVEAQLQSGHAGDFWNIGAFPMQGDVERPRGARTLKSAAAERPLGEWNRYEITVDRDRVSLRVNDVPVNEARALEIAGRIGLQSEGTEIHFRNIRLEPLALP